MGVPGFVAMKAVGQVTQGSVREFVQQAISPGLVDEWLPWVHLVISNFKSDLPGTYQSVSGRHLQEYLEVFCCRLNRRYWEKQIPNRLLKLCATHQPILLQPVAC
jgi:hypothetical protein